MDLNHTRLPIPPYPHFCFLFEDEIYYIQLHPACQPFFHFYYTKPDSPRTDFQDWRTESGNQADVKAKSGFVDYSNQNRNGSPGRYRLNGSEHGFDDFFRICGRIGKMIDMIAGNKVVGSTRTVLIFKSINDN